MDCFGEIKKLSTSCSITLPTFSNRIVLAHPSKPIFLITESENFVSLYDLSKDVRLVQNWSFDELTKLRIPLAVRWVDGSKKCNYIGVHSGNYLIEWTVNDGKLEQVFKKKFRCNIIALISSSHCHFDTLVVFENGVADFYQNVIIDFYETTMVPVIDRSHKIIHIGKNISSSNHLLLYYITKSNANIVNFYKLRLSKDNIQPTISQFSISKTFDAYAHFSKNNILVAASKVDNRMEVYSLTSNESLKMIHSFGSINFDKIRSLASCSNGAICALGEKDKAFIIEVFEAQYSTKIGHLNLIETVLPKDLAIISDRLFIVCTNSIIVAEVIGQKILLSRMLTDKTLAVPLLENNKPAYSEELKLLLGNFSSEQPVNLKMVKTIRASFIRRLLQISQNYNVPEEIIAFLFDFTTKNYIKVEMNNNQEDREEILNELTDLFNEMIKVPFNDIFLRSCLKNCNIKHDQYLLAIEILLKDKSIFNECFVLMWLSVILDYNFKDFILKADERKLKLLTRLRDLINENIQFYEGSVNVKLMLDSLLRLENAILATISGKKVSFGQYSIELLTFS